MSLAPRPPPAVHPVRAGLRALAGIALASVLLPGPRAAAEPAAPAPAADPAEPPAEPPPRWRFRREDRPVKVISLGGSIAAWPKDAYPDRIERMCAAVEVRDIARTGLGAWALKKRFVQQVLENRHLDFRHEGWEFWLLLGGTLNSVGNPRRHNHHTRRLFELAHRRGIRVVALSPTPWGDPRDRRFRTAPSAARYVKATHRITDYLLGRLSPAEALGRDANRRAAGADAPWQPEELPDVAIDLYDSPLRAADAAAGDETRAREELAADAGWRRAHRELDEAARAAALAADARVAAEAPRWALRPELRAFDHIHPNAEGHRIMAETICPKLPASWGCTCPAPKTPLPSGAPAGPAAE